jgi:hypothetical protein
MGHADVKTTEIYTHVMEKDISAVLSPLDRLAPTEGSKNGMFPEHAEKTGKRELLKKT